MSDQDIRASSLEYHRAYPPGKISILPTKDLTNQRDLALAYTPGVAAACDEIVRDPGEARNLTARGNLVAVVTNGTAVLGLGAIGPLASKPVMEGKAVLFKKFAGLDCFDIELDERDHFPRRVAGNELAPVDDEAEDNATAAHRLEGDVATTDAAPLLGWVVPHPASSAPGDGEDPTFGAVPVPPTDHIGYGHRRCQHRVGGGHGLHRL